MKTHVRDKKKITWQALVPRRFILFVLCTFSNFFHLLFKKLIFDKNLIARKFYVLNTERTRDNGDVW